jgi:phosphatidylinositol alpha-1,6-mannosyltransferase
MRPAARILLVTRNFPPAEGGIETMARELAEHATDSGLELVVAHLGQSPCLAPSPGIAAYRHLRARGKWSTLLLSLVAVPSLVLRFRPDMVVNMQVTTAPGSLVARLCLGVPYKVIALGLEVLPPERKPLALSWRTWSLRGAREVVSISRFTDSLIERFGVPPARRRVINPGTRTWPPIDRDPGAAFGPLPAGQPFIMLTVSRLVARKGVDMALEALALVLERRRDIFYCIGGGGPDRARLEALVAEKNLGAHVRFLGRVPDERMGLCYASADLFVLPSRTSIQPPDAEGFGIVFLEAAACGTPSIGGKSGGIPDAIDDGVTGFLCDPHDPRAIAERILQLMDDAALRTRMSEAALARAQRAGWTEACAAYWEALRAP